jgi:hypothetical protein
MTHCGWKESEGDGKIIMYFKLLCDVIIKYRKYRNRNQRTEVDTILVENKKRNVEKYGCCHLKISYKW